MSLLLNGKGPYTDEYISGLISVIFLVSLVCRNAIDFLKLVRVEVLSLKWNIWTVILKRRKHLRHANTYSLWFGIPYYGNWCFFWLMWETQIIQKWYDTLYGICWPFTKLQRTENCVKVLSISICVSLYVYLLSIHKHLGICYCQYYTSKDAPFP